MGWFSYRGVVYAFTLFHFLITSGVIYGFVPLQTFLIADGQYDELSIDDRDIRLNQMFTIGSVTIFCALPFFGFVLDRVGPRYISAAATFVCGCGAALLAASDSKTFDAFHVAYFLLGLGGAGQQLAGMHICNLFPAHQSMALSLITGSVGLASLTYPIITALPDPRAGLWGHAVVTFVFMFIAFWVYPTKEFALGDRASFTRFLRVSVRHDAIRFHPVLRENAKKGEELADGVDAAEAEESEQAESESESASSGDASGSADGDVAAARPARSRSRLSSSEDETDAAAAAPAAKTSVGTQMRRTEYKLLLVIFPVLNFVWNAYVGSVAVQLQGRGDDGTQAAIFGWISPFGALVAPWLIGPLVDSGRLGGAWSVALTLGVAFNLCNILLPLAWQPVSFVLYAVHIESLFGTFHSHLARRFGFEHWGVLNGVVLFLSGIVIIVQSLTLATAIKALGRNFLPLNVGMVLLYILAVPLPAYMHRQPRDGATGGGHGAAAVTSVAGTGEAEPGGAVVLPIAPPLRVGDGGDAAGS